MTKDADGAAKNLAIIRPGRYFKNSIYASEPLADPYIESDKGVWVSVSEKPPHQNCFTDLILDDFLESLGQSTFSGPVNGLSDGVNE